MNRKVITNYRIDNDDTSSTPPAPGIPDSRILSQPKVSANERKIPTRDKSQPQLRVVKNTHGVVTSLHITCSCGEEITVLLDYE